MKKKFLIILFFIYLIALFRITVFRSGFGLKPLFKHGKLNLLPLVELANILEKQGLLLFVYLFIGNIIWFVPFGYLLPQITNKKINVFTIALYGLGLSFMIEFCQYMFGTGVSELDDLILNTLGAICGFYLRKLV